jgi:hypothetical protein
MASQSLIARTTVLELRWKDHQAKSPGNAKGGVEERSEKAKELAKD